MAAFANARYVGLQSGSRLEILKAKQRLAIGRTVSLEDFEAVPVYGSDLQQMKALFVDRDAFAAYERLALGETLLPGQPLMKTSFGYDGTRDIRDGIQPNERAVALRLENEAAAAGFHPVPGSLVDVWVNDPGATVGEHGGQTKVLRAVKVWAIDGMTQLPGPGDGTLRYRSVTVVVPEAEVGQLLQKTALTRGAVTLTLLGRCGEQSCS